MLKTKTPITLFMVGLHYDNAKQDVRNFISTARKSPLIDVGNHSYTHAHNHYRYFYHHCSDVIQDLKKNNTTLGLKGDLLLQGYQGEMYSAPLILKKMIHILQKQKIRWRQ